MSFEVSEHVDAITEMVIAASALSLKWFRQPMTVENKGTGEATDHSIDRFDPVTAADRAVEDALRASLTDRFPDHEVMGEERGTTGRGEYRWVIDPIDGTRAFIGGQPLWGTILGLQHGDRVLAGWMHQPTLGHTYVASPAGVVLQEGAVPRPIQTSGITALADALVLCTHPSMFSADHEIAGWNRIESRARLTRYGGDCINYGYLASGFADLVVDNGLQPYDIIPVVPIVERAGGVVTGLNGESPLGGGWAIAAATAELHQAALEALQETSS